MDPRKFLLPAVPVVLSVLGCVPTTVPGPKFTIVPTETAGVVFVVVHPSPNKPKGIEGAVQPGDGKKVSNDADYIMLCDGRPVDGMRCELLAEAGMSRFSYHPLVAPAPKAVDEPVGSTFVYSYSDTVIQSRAKSDAPPSKKPDADDTAASTPLLVPPPASSSAPNGPSSNPDSATRGGSK